jgi:hypothetical protein
MPWFYVQLNGRPFNVVKEVDYIERLPYTGAMYQRRRLRKRRISRRGSNIQELERVPLADIWGPFSWQ